MYLKLFLHSYFRFYFAQLQLGAGFCRKFLNLISHRSIPPLYQLVQVKYIAEKGSRKPINYFGTTALGKVVKVEFPGRFYWPKFHSPSLEGHCRLIFLYKLHSLWIRWKQLLVCSLVNASRHVSCGVLYTLKFLPRKFPICPNLSLFQLIASWLLENDSLCACFENWTQGLMDAKYVTKP